MSDRKQLRSSDEVLKKVNHRAGALYDFVSISNGMMEASSFKMDELELSMVEIRITLEIDSNPGVTSTQLCHTFNRSRGAISQSIKKIKDKGLMYRQQSAEDGKVWGLFTTDLGHRAAQRFIAEDMKDSTNIMSSLLRKCSEADLKSFYKVVDAYTRMLIESPESRWT